MAELGLWGGDFIGHRHQRHADQFLDLRSRDCYDYGAQSRHAHSSLEARGVQRSKNTSLSAGKRHRCSKRQQTLQTQCVKYDLLFTISLDQTSELNLTLKRKTEIQLKPET